MLPQYTANFQEKKYNTEFCVRNDKKGIYNFHRQKKTTENAASSCPAQK